MPKDTEEQVNSESTEAAPAPKKRTRRVARKAAEDSAPAEVTDVPVVSEEAPVKPRRRPGRPRKVKAEVSAEVAEANTVDAKPAETSASAAAPAEAGPAAEPEAKPKRRPGRPRKVKADAAASTDTASSEGADSAAPAPAQEEPTAEKPKRTRRKAKAKADDAEQTPAGEFTDSGAQPGPEQMTRMTQEATQASSEPTDMPATTVAEADAQASSSTYEGTSEKPKESAKPEGENSQPEQGSRRSRRNRRNKFDRDGGDQRQDGNGQNNNQNNNQNGNGRRDRNNKRNKRNREFNAEPTLSMEEVAAMKVVDLRSKAAELGIEYVGLRKAELTEAVYNAAARAEGFRPVNGILEIGNEGSGWLRTGNYMAGDDDCFVHQSLIRSVGLRPGDRVTGTVGPNRNNVKYPPLIKVETVNGGPVEGLKSRPRFRDLTPIFPNERLSLENGKNSITGRAIDLVSPIGKGQRGLIVSPPKAGKTTVLKKICQAIAVNNPEVHLFCLLVDERPEEVTDMERSIKGEVVASTFDMPASNHTHVSELVIEHAKRLVEMGEDVVVVLDSITRLARAYNLAAPASGRILSGGVDSAALYPPKKFLGAARNIENGGSLTIIASALVDTGSKMDEVIFEEFKGTGNMELKLDRDLADRRIFPAIDPVASGTRNEDLLVPAEYQPFVWGIRRILANMNNTERAANALVKGLKGTNDNREFLIKSAKKAQQTDYVS